MVVRNRRLWSWFDSKRISEAILGEKEYFIPDVTYRDKHDRTLVLNQLFQWATARSFQTEAARGVENAVKEAMRRNLAWEVFDILWVYFLTVDDLHFELPVEPEVFQQVANQMAQSTGGHCDDEFNSLENAVNARIHARMSKERRESH